MIDDRRLFVRDLEPAGHLLGQHLHQLGHRAEFFELSELVSKIFERKLIARHLAQLFLRFFFVYLALNLFDKAQNVAHTEYSLGDTVRIERLDRVVLFADTDEFDRLADDLFDREGSTAASVAVHFGQNDTGNADTLVKDLSRANSILTCHRIGDKEHFDRLGLGFDLLEFDHQLVVDVQTARGIDHQGIETILDRVVHGTANDRHRIVGVLGLKYRDVYGVCDDLELLTGCGTVHVDRNEQRFALLIVSEPA